MKFNTELELMLVKLSVLKHKYGDEAILFEEIANGGGGFRHIGCCLTENIPVNSIMAI